MHLSFDYNFSECHGEVHPRVGNMQILISQNSYQFLSVQLRALERELDMVQQRIDREKDAQKASMERFGGMDSTQRHRQMMLAEQVEESAEAHMDARDWARLQELRQSLTRGDALDDESSQEFEELMRGFQEAAAKGFSDEDARDLSRHGLDYVQGVGRAHARQTAEAEGYGEFLAWDDGARRMAADRAKREAIEITLEDQRKVIVTLETDYQALAQQMRSQMEPLLDGILKMTKDIAQQTAYELRRELIEKFEKFGNRD